MLGLSGDRSRAEKLLLVELASQCVISNTGLQPTLQQWDHIASEFNASVQCSSQATKTELLKLWRTLRTEAERSRRNNDDKVVKNPIFGKIDRLLQQYPPKNPKSPLKSRKSPLKCKKVEIPPDPPRRSSRKLYSGSFIEETDDIEMADQSNRGTNIHAEFLDHLAFKRPKTVSKRSPLSPKSGVGIKTKDAYVKVNEKRRNKRQEICPDRFSSDAATGLGNKRKPVVSPKSLSEETCDVQNQRMESGEISCSSPRPGTPYPTLIKGSTVSRTPMYFLVDDSSNTVTVGDGIYSGLAGGVVIDANPGSDLNDVSDKDGIVRYHSFTNNDLVSTKMKFVTVKTLKPYDGSIATAAMAANSHGRVTNITREGSFFFPHVRENPRIAAFGTGLVATNSGVVGHNYRTVTASAGIVANNSRLVTSNAGIISNNSRMVTSSAGIIANNSGLPANASGFLANNSGLLTNHSGSLNNNSGSLNNNSGLLTNNSGLLTNNSGLLTNNSGLLTNNSGSLTNTSGSLSNNSGSLSNNSGSLTNNSGSLTNNSGSLTNNSGSLTNNSGLLTNNSGLLTNNSGLLTNNSGLLTVSGRIVANNTEMMASNCGMVASNSRMVAVNCQMVANKPSGIIANNPPGSVANNPPGSVANNPLRIVANDPPGIVAINPPSIVANNPPSIVANNPPEMETNNPHEMVANDPLEMVANNPPEMETNNPHKMVANNPHEMVANNPHEMVANNPLEMVTNNSPEMVASNPPEMVASNPPEMVASNPSEIVANNPDLVKNNAGVVTSNAEVLATSSLPTSSLATFSRLTPFFKPRSPNSPASGVNSQPKSTRLSTSTPERTFLIPSSLLKDSTNIHARNEVTSQCSVSQFKEELEVTKLRQAKELHAVQKKFHEAQIMMERKIADQSRELHDAKMKNEDLIAEQNRKFEEDKMKLEKEKLKQLLEFEKQLHDVRMRSEEEINKQRKELHVANFRAINHSLALKEALHNVEIEAARLKLDKAAANQKLALLQLKKVELELERLSAPTRNSE